MNIFDQVVSQEIETEEVAQIKEYEKIINEYDRLTRSMTAIIRQLCQDVEDLGGIPPVEVVELLKDYDRNKEIREA